MAENCSFAHGEQELGTVRTVDESLQPPKPVIPLSATLRSSGTGPVKTKMCTYFQMGTCTRGNRCTFAHGDTDLGTPYDPSLAPGSGAAQFGTPHPNIGMGGMGGMGVGELMVMDTEKGKVPHHTDGIVLEELEGLLVSDPNLTDDFMKFCSEQLGFAAPPGAGGPPGANNSFRFKKSRLCNNFQASGNCPRGDSCNFAHGEEQLGAPQPGPPAAQKSLMYEALQKAQNVPDFMLKKTKLCTFFMGGNCQRGEACAFAHGEHEIGMPQTGDISVKAMEKVLSGDGGMHVPTFNGLSRGAPGTAPPKATGETFLGIIKSYNEKNAFGFIQSEEVQAKYNGDCFFPGRFVQENPGMNVGDMVEFDVGMSSKGQPQAIAVRPFNVAGLASIMGTATTAPMDQPMPAPAIDGPALATMDPVTTASVLTALATTPATMDQPMPAADAPAP